MLSIMYPWIEEILNLYINKLCLGNLISHLRLDYNRYTHNMYIATIHIESPIETDNESENLYNLSIKLKRNLKQM